MIGCRCNSIKPRLQVIFSIWIIWIAVRWAVPTRHLDNLFMEWDDCSAVKKRATGDGALGKEKNIAA